MLKEEVKMFKMRKEMILTILIILSLFTVSTVFAEPIHGATYTITDSYDSNAIQNILNQANPGDELDFTASDLSHIRLSVNKTVKIKSSVGTVINVCPMAPPSGSDDFCAFYFGTGASGSSISGFVINNNAPTGYCIDVNSKKITISNCTLKSNAGSAINIKDSETININNNRITGSVNGINIKTGTKNVNIINNMITNNRGNGITMSASNNVLIQNNTISLNNRHGIHVNCDFTNLKIINNFISQNNYCGAVYDTGVTMSTDDIRRNSVVSGNYVVYNGYGFSNARDLVRWLHPNGAAPRGEFPNDQTCFGVNDIKDAHLCPGTKLSTVSTNYVVLGNISEISDGVYQVEFIIKETGKRATALGGFNVDFILNKKDLSFPYSQTGDITKTVSVNNGIGIVNFYNSNYNSTGNTIFVNSPQTATNRVMTSLYSVLDDNIPSLKVSVSVDKSKSELTGEVVYTVKVINIGNSNVSNVNVNYLIPSGFSMSSFTTSKGSYSDGVWTIDSVNTTEESPVLVIRAIGTKLGTVTSQAVLTADSITTKYSNVLSQTVVKKSNKNQTNNTDNGGSNGASSGIGMLNTGAPISSLVFAVLGILSVVFVSRKE